MIVARESEDECTHQNRPDAAIGDLEELVTVREGSNDHPDDDKVRVMANDNYCYYLQAHSIWESLHIRRGMDHPIRHHR